MSSAATTPQFRALGWNVHILCGPEGDRFAGLFHPPGSTSLTYRDIVNELRLCFNIPISYGAEDNESSDAWANIAFGYGESTSGSLQPLKDDFSTTSISSPQMLSGQYLDGFITTPLCDLSSDIIQPSIVQLHIVRHTECGLGPIEPFIAHLQAGCAQHIPYPSLRRDERYLPPNKGSRDPRFARLPYRKRTHPTGSSQSSPKCSASGSISPNKDSQPDNDGGGGEDVTDMVSSLLFDISSEEARRTMAAFRTSCLAASTKCAVTGKGRSWYMSPTVGPAVQVGHIVPQQHSHVYPVPIPFGNNRYSPRRLRAAWDRTWSAENGIILLTHLYELFDARLFSIHPETLRVRVFMPYDVLLDYHGTIAQLSSIVDRKALRHHYEMCCIENMAAKMPLSEASEALLSSAASGTISPFESGSHIPNIPRVIFAGKDSPQIPGDPSKRARPPGKPADDTAQFDIMPLTIDGSSTSSSLRHRASPPDQIVGIDMCSIPDQAEEAGRKKRRRYLGSQNAVWIYNEERHDPYWEGCITSWNSQEFLADVNWELAKIESRP